jgi:antibiotic biosynthesis monooxygenase (ABM) superfamily enzyme
MIAGDKMAIKRVWHGWTTLENADVYHQLLNDHVIPGIEAKNIPGYLGFEILRRNHENEVEFVTIITFESLQSVIEFQGEDYSRCYVPDAAQKVLKRWDKHASHYEALEHRNYIHVDA